MLKKANEDAFQSTSLVSNQEQHRQTAQARKKQESGFQAKT